MTTFYFIRHGQTAANVAGLKQGQINTPNTYLTPTGKQQAAALADRFSIALADQLFYSPLTRTKQTADILNQSAKLPMTADDRLLEISYGEWDGQDNAKLVAAHPEVFDPLIHEVLPSYVTLAPHGETFKAVIERVQAFMQSTSEQFPTGNLIVVTHGFTVKAAALAVTAVPDAMRIPEPDNTSVTQIDYYPDAKQGYLISYNA